MLKITIENTVVSDEDAIEGEISFHEAAKYLICTAKGLNPENHESEVG